MSVQDDKKGDQIVVDDKSGGEADDKRLKHDQVVLDGDKSSSSDEGNQKTVPVGFYRRIGKLNDKVDEANTRASESDARNDLLKEENKLLRMQVDALKGGGQSDDDEEDEGRGMTQADVDRRAREIVQEELNSASSAGQQAAAQDANTKKLEAHYDRAAELKVDDYEDTEDKAIDILGKDLSRFVMSSSNKSQLLLYYIGKNPGVGYELARKIQADPGSGALEIGELAAKLSLRKADTQNDDDLPEPDSDLGGDSQSGSSVNEQRLQKMRSDVAAGKRPMKDLMDLKRKLAEAS